MRSRSAFDGILGVIYPMFFATSVLLMYRQAGSEEALINAAVGASMLGVWSAVATTAAISLQAERRQGTLELLVAAPTPFTLLLVPMTLAMATIGLYSLVATLLWGRFAFGIPISLEAPAGVRVRRGRHRDRGEPDGVPPGGVLGPLPRGPGRSAPAWSSRSG